MERHFFPRRSIAGRLIPPAIRMSKSLIFNRLVPITTRRHIIEVTARSMRRIPGYLGENIAFAPHIVGEKFTGNSEHNKAGAILYLHGGGYMICSVDTHRPILSRLAQLTGYDVYAPNYRLAPEHPFPAPVEDVGTSYRYLIEEKKIPAENIIVGGDSAGGGLTLALAHYARKHKLPQPRAMFLISPWLDLTHTKGSRLLRYHRDPMIDKGVLAEFTEHYVPAPADRDHEFASPVLGGVDHLPPALIQIATEEVLWDDSVRLYRNIIAGGGKAEIQKWDSLFHVFQAFPRVMPEAREALREVANFIHRTERIFTTATG